MKTEVTLTLIATFVSFLAFCMSIVALLINRQQEKVKNLVTLQRFSHEHDLSEARRMIRENEAAPTLKDQHVRHVCSTFDFAGMLVRHGAVNKLMFLDYWRLPLLALEEPLTAIADQDRKGGCERILQGFLVAHERGQKVKRLAQGAEGHFMTRANEI